jgi:hypothetical protein
VVASTLHEVLVQIASEVPDLLRTLLRDGRGLVLGDVAVPTGPQAVTNLDHPPFTADAVLLERRDDVLVGVCVLEVQLGRDDDKKLAWPVYMTVLRAKHRVPVRVIVMAPRRTVARWAASPIVLDGAASVVQPIVIGPDLIPEVTDVDRAAAMPELAVLSAVTHGRGRAGIAIGRAGLAALDRIPQRYGALYADIILRSLGKRAREALEADMPIENYEFKSAVLRQIFDKGKAEGEAKGEAEGRASEARRLLLRQLKVKFRDVPRHRRAEVAAASLEQLESWAEQLVTADTLDAVFD